MKNLKKIDFLLKKLFNMNRTLISKENRNTFNIIKKIIPLKILKFKTNSKVFDWKIPYEWQIKEAYISDINNNKIINYKDNFLHVASYGSKINKMLIFNILKDRLFTSDKLPNSIPYRTQYYNITMQTLYRDTTLYSDIKLCSDIALIAIYHS